MKKNKLKRNEDIEIHEILHDYQDSEMLDTKDGIGRFNVEISQNSIKLITLFIIIAFIVLFSRIFLLQVIQGHEYREISSNNIFSSSTIFAERGNIYDRNGEIIATNIHKEGDDFSRRKYDSEAFGHLIGYVSYPKKDKKGIYYEDYTTGKLGIEKLFDSELRGDNGAIFFQRNALGEVIQEHFINPNSNGKDIHLSIDKELQIEAYSILKEITEDREFNGGSINIMDVNTGSLLTSVSYPSFDPNHFSVGDEERINSYLNDKRSVLLNRAVSGLYSPGSSIKPFFGVAALEESLISPNKYIHGGEYIRIENPYLEGEYSYFRDWKPHGSVNLREAISVSSNIYFYNIGGGYANQPGLGIDKLARYAKIFGFSNPTKTKLGGEPSGVIPTPKWKENIFGEEWRLGDTYNTSIGQYGFQVTPLQLTRGVAAIANRGKLVEPKVVIDDKVNFTNLAFKKDSSIEEVVAGMRLAVTNGTARLLDVDYVEIAAKTGTSQIGSRGRVNSLVVGFFPYTKPKYGFTVVLENGPDRLNDASAVIVMRKLFNWMYRNRSEYLE